MKTEDEHNCLDEDKFQSNIEKYGWTVILIEATDYLPSFAYTTGLWKNYQHPELICFGLSVKTLHGILNDAGELIKAGQTLQTDYTYTDFFEENKTEFIPVDGRNIADYFGTAIGFYQTADFPAMQLIWTDRDDKFPWETDYEEEFKFKQPLLDRNADFKYSEAHNLGIFTTKQWIDNGDPIVHVVHDHDGDWQFLTADARLEDAKLVCLSEMIKRDDTLNEVFNLDYGEEALRESIGGIWTRSKFDEEAE